MCLTHGFRAVSSEDGTVILPTVDELPPLLLELAVPHEDIDEIVAALPAMRSPEAQRLLDEGVRQLVGRMGATVPAEPVTPPADAVWHRHFHLFLFLAMLPHVRAYHAERGIPGEITRLTLADIGRSVAVNRFRHGTSGVRPQLWLTLHVTGALYQLGRLQFERSGVGPRSSAALRAAGIPLDLGDPVLSVHIPGFYGPLTPQACADSFARAREFFPRHFPDERYDIAVCKSWLLDGQLADYLPAESNIVAFQRLFQSSYLPEEDDEDIMHFVFGRVGVPLDELPRRTTLQRAVVDHIAAGRHWRGGAGWRRL
jgi:hypothetical protein